MFYLNIRRLLFLMSFWWQSVIRSFLVLFDLWRESALILCRDSPDIDFLTHWQSNVILPRSTYSWSSSELILRKPCTGNEAIDLYMGTFCPPPLRFCNKIYKHEVRQSRSELRPKASALASALSESITAIMALKN